MFTNGGGLTVCDCSNFADSYFFPPNRGTSFFKDFESRMQMRIMPLLIPLHLERVLLPSTSKLCSTWSSEIVKLLVLYPFALLTLTLNSL